MPQIKPFDLAPEIPDALNDLLAEAAPELATKKDTNLDLAAARRALRDHGAGVDDVARTIARVMQDGETDNIKLKAAELAFRVQGILQEIDNKSIPIININIVGDETKSLINLILPTV